MSDYIITTPSKGYAIEFDGYKEITADDVKACITGLSDECQTVSNPPEPPTPIHPPAVFQGQSVVLPDGSQRTVPECLWSCLTGDATTQAVGGSGAAAVLEGTIPKKMFGIPTPRGVSKFTSVGSIVAHKWPHLNGPLPKWMPNKAPIFQFNRLPPGIKMSPTAGKLRFIGRWIPGIGWGLLAADLIVLDQCVAGCRGEKSFLRQLWEETVGVKEAY